MGKTSDKAATEEPTVIRYTGAPEEYDYGYTATLEVLPYKHRGPYGKRIRKVAIQADMIDHQTGRYRSGLYQALDEAQWQDWLARDLVEHIPSETK